MRKTLLTAFVFSLLLTSCGMEHTSLNNYGSQENSGSQYSFPYQENQQASIEEKNASYYQTLSDYARSRGKKVVVLNPGTVPAPVYFDFADYIVTYEDSADNLDGMDYSGFPQKSVRMVYGVDRSDLQEVENRIRSYCQYIYLTDDTSPNPYDSLPSYIDKEEKAIQE